MTPWWAIDVHVTQPEHSSALAEWLVDRTRQALEQQPNGVLVASVPDPESADSLIEELRSQWGTTVGPVAVRALPDIDWRTRWREGLGPRRIGRLTVVPSWIQSRTAADGPVLVLDPESAFGSGEHGSTRAAWLLLDHYLQTDDQVLDLGSGSGILALAAIKLGAARAVGVEIDADAIPVARRNAERNQVADRVTFLEGDAGTLAPLLGPAPIIVSNILRLANVSLLPAIAASLTPGGRAIFSGMESSESELFIPELMARGFRVVDQVTDDGWWAVAASC